MPANLAALSFILASIFALFLISPRIRNNVPKLALILWLFVGNLIHGINAVEWSGNVDMSAPIWCDIVTRVLLGANVALPAAFICIARELERISSTREYSADAHTQRINRIIDAILCYILPLIYMSLYSIGQDHRFDIVKDYGCSAAIHPSTPALIIVWLPPLLLCSIALIFSGAAIHHSFRQSMYHFSEHLSSRSNLTSSLFLRTVSICLITSAVLTLTTLFALFAPPTLLNWTSWDDVHKHFYDIDIVTSSNDTNSIRLTWWGLAAVSIAYAALLLIFGEEVRDGVKWINKKIREWSSKRRRAPQQPLLLLHAKSAHSQVTLAPTVPSHPPPEALQLKSGWDDMLDAKLPKRQRSKPQLALPLSLSPVRSNSSSPSPSSRYTPSPTFSLTPTSANPFGPSRTPSLTRSPTSPGSDDDVFAANTISYLNTPIAQSLGLTSPPAVYTSPSPQKTTYTDIAPWRSPPKVTHSPVRAEPLTPTKRGSLNPDARPLMGSLALLSVKQTVPEDATSTISSIWDAPWPQPPERIPESPVGSVRGMPRGASAHSLARSQSSAHSRSDSPASLPSNDTFGYPILSSAASQTPFQGPTIEPVESIPELQVARPKSPQGVSRRPSLRSLRSWDSFGRGSGTGSLAKEVIYMTVVKETV
ncbi:hypothetical protein HGRIS_007124 [Hohenbuehelia grisea]|uniref:Pheromone receptor n=1 Tax=Hohenbuehelia grisea TaxID=104357 RepID=A0ABR3JB41_9AGAR